jgi:[ribosomal protein S5]-alanine N-acetyltransferase
VTLRPIRRRDRAAWQRLRDANRDWLYEWDATLPPGDIGSARSFPSMVHELRSMARAGRCLPFVVEYDDQLVGQLTVSNIVWGSARWGQVGYWVDRAHAGRGIMPTAVALSVDHCFSAVGLHRIEIAIRPENYASLRVVAKLGLCEIGLAPNYLHINGAWRDHRVFGVTVEDVPGGLLAKWRQSARGGSRS